MIGDALAGRGYDVSVMNGAQVDDVRDFGAVVVAGALYGGRWHRDARRFVRRHSKELRRVPVWLVSSGPLDDSAARHPIPPTRQVLELGRLVQARGHLTFGGRLAPDARGFPASAMAKKKAGDWRDPDHVRAFAEVVDRALTEAARDGQAVDTKAAPPSR